MMFDRLHSQLFRTAAFLGNVVSANHSKMQEENISALRDWPREDHSVKSEILRAIARTTESLKSQTCPIFGKKNIDRLIDQATSWCWMSGAESFVDSRRRRTSVAIAFLKRVSLY